MKQFYYWSLLFITASAAFYQSTAGCPVRPDSGCVSPHALGHYLTIGGALVDNNAINDRVESLSYPGFSPHALSLGFGGLHRFGRYVSGAEIEGLAWKPNRGAYFSSLRVGRLVSLHGVSLLSSPDVALYPLVGIGVGMSSLKVKRNETDFNTALNTPPVSTMHSETVTQMTMLVDLGFGFRLSRPMHPGMPGVKTIGMRAGYMFDPLDNKTWRRGDAVLDNGPHSNLSGPYLKLTIGKSGGGNRHCEKERCSRPDNNSCATMCPAGKGKCPSGPCCPQMKESCKPGACPHMMSGCKNAEAPRPEGAGAGACGMKPPTPPESK